MMNRLLFCSTIKIISFRGPVHPQSHRPYQCILKKPWQSVLWWATLTFRCSSITRLIISTDLDVSHPINDAWLRGEEKERKKRDFEVTAAILSKLTSSLKGTKHSGTMESCFLISICLTMVAGCEKIIRLSSVPDNVNATFALTSSDCGVPDSSKILFICRSLWHP